MPGGICEDSWDLEADLDLRFLLLPLPRPPQGKSCYSGPDTPTLEPVSDELLISLVFGEETRCIKGERSKTRRHARNQMNSQDMLCLSFPLPPSPGEVIN